MFDLNEKKKNPFAFASLDQLAKANGVRWYGHVLRK